MNDRLPSLPIEARQRHPYRSLYAALLLQSFQDALAEALPNDDSRNSGGGGTAPRQHSSPSTKSRTPVRQA